MNFDKDEVELISMKKDDVAGEEERREREFDKYREKIKSSENLVMVELHKFREKFISDEQVEYLKEKSIEDGVKLFSEHDLGNLEKCPLITDDEHYQVTWFTRLFCNNVTPGGLPVLNYIGKKNCSLGHFYNIYSFLNKPYCVRTGEVEETKSETN